MLEKIVTKNSRLGNTVILPKIVVGRTKTTDPISMITRTNLPNYATRNIRYAPARGKSGKLSGKYRR